MHQLWKFTITSLLLMLRVADGAAPVAVLCDVMFAKDSLVERSAVSV